MDDLTAKGVARELVNRWIKRAGFQKQAIAARAGFGSYDDFYRSYLDKSRGLNTSPADAIRVVRAVVEGLPAAARCTADEAVDFFIATRLPLDRYPEIAQLQLFAPADWRAAIERHLGAGLPAAEGGLDAAALLAQIDALVRGRPAEPPPADRLDHMPLGDDAPLPEPAPLPAPRRMPLLRGRLFGGRDSELRALARLVHAQEIGGAVAITGLGGTGKTSLASEFVHRYGQFFAGGVFWLDASDPRNLALDAVSCGEAGLVSADDWPELDFAERLRLVRQAWQEPAPRLLVLDSCEDDATLMGWRPVTGGCRVIITSRRARWSRSVGVEALPLRELSPDAARALLRRYRPDLPADEPALAAIAAELGFLPLALHLAGSFLETHQDDRRLGSPARLLDDLRAAGPLGHNAMRGVDVAPSVTAHDQHVGRTFALSIDRLDAGDPHEALALGMLGRAAWLAPGQPFEVELLADAAGGADTAARGAARRLVDLGLLSAEPGALRIHRLVAEHARDALGAAPARAELARALVERVAQTYDARDLPAARLLLPHMSALADELARSGGPDEVVPLWNGLPFLLELVGDIRGGLDYLARAYGALLRDETLETAIGAEVLNNLAEWRRSLGEVEPARQLHQQALAIRLGLRPPDELAIAESYGNMGELLRGEGDYEAARTHYERALELALRSGGPRHDKTLSVRNNLALLLYTQGLYAEAADQFAPLLAAAEEAFAPGDPRIAYVRMNLASALFYKGELHEGRAQLELAAAALRAALGDEHPDTLRARLNAARGAVMAGEAAQGAAELRAIIGPLAAAYGGEHPLVKLAKETLDAAEGTT